MKKTRQKISAFVISYNGEPTIRACLRSLSFADEIILVDKSSTDGTVEAAMTLCDRIVVISWSPVVEETRQFALDMCQHDWVVFLDDDEILNIEAIEQLERITAAGEPLICGLPRKEYIIGRHIPTAYYWPNWQIRLFHRKVMSFSGTVHAGFVTEGKLINIPLETGARIEHFSHSDVSSWIEKTNRYTSQVDRNKSSKGSEKLIDFSHEAINRYAPKSDGCGGRGYESAIGVLRAVYEIIDALKEWERQQASVPSFRELASRLEAQHLVTHRRTRITHEGELVEPRNVSMFRKVLLFFGFH